MLKITTTAIELWETDLYSLQMIATFFGVSRQAVRNYLRKHGVDTSIGGLRLIQCDNCGDLFEKPRSQIRHNKYNYCKPECYHIAMQEPEHQINRQAQIKACRSVSLHYPLKETDVVYFRDHDQDNDNPNNLIVFASQADCNRWIRVGRDKAGVRVLWP